MGFVIRELKTYHEMFAVHQLQREIWGIQIPDMGLYPPVLNTAAKNGGVVLGAFSAPEDQMIGFSFGFMGRAPGGPLKLCSQAMGVLPAWRGQGVAEALKQTQRERVIAQDLPLITWTYDPLEGPNAYLNLHKLHAISRTYQRDLYGSDFGALNAGLPSDRLLVEWWVSGVWLETGGGDALDGSAAAAVAETTGTGLSRRISRLHLDRDAPLLSLPSVPDLQALKAVDLELAHDWRLNIRRACEFYFAQGYVAVDFRSSGRGAERQNRYLLQRASPELLARIGVIAGAV